jgi:hypothetical protein
MTFSDHFSYVESDIPEDMTLGQWRTVRDAARRAAHEAEGAGALRRLRGRLRAVRTDTQAAPASPTAAGRWRSAAPRPGAVADGLPVASARAATRP